MELVDAMSTTLLSVILGIIGFVLNIVVLTVAGVWKLSQVEKGILAAVSAHRTEVDDEFNLMRREFGETAQAIRQRIADVELWGRDNYVKKDSFTLVTDRLSKEVEASADRIEKRIDRMEEKIAQS